MSAADLARSGEYLAALRANTELVEQVIGYEYGPVRAELARRGALGSGVSGIGPTLAAIVPPDRCASVIGGFPPDDGDVLAVDFVGPAAAAMAGAEP